MVRTLLISVPGLSRDLLAHVPPDSSLARLVARSRVCRHAVTWPAVTCAVQAGMTTGTTPAAHGMIANGLPTYRSPADADRTDPANLATYRRKVSFWEQSNHLLEAPRVWSGKGLKTALLFFQNSMPGFTAAHSPAADIVLTPKPDHGPDGKITSLLWSNPPELASTLQRDLGPFPLMNYWGPLAGLKASQWIVSAAARLFTEHQPDLQLTYVPHLDYDLQRFGPDSPQARQAVVDLAGVLEPLIECSARARVIVVGEYAIEPVTRAIAPNRALHKAGLLKLAENFAGEGPSIDYERSAAWVLCDHQCGHVYLGDPSRREAVTAVLDSLGLDPVAGVQHRRAGELQVVAPRGVWLDYRWWDESENASAGGLVPAWARTVDIHRKPGYDPLELFFDPVKRSIISDASRIRGSHGRASDHDAVLLVPTITTCAEVIRTEEIAGLLLAP